MPTAAYVGYGGGSEISKYLRMLTLEAGGEFVLNLTQNKSNYYDLDTERLKICR